MRVYDCSILHGVNKQYIIPGERGKVASLDLGNIPEEVVTEKINPLIIQLAEVLEKYKIYVWVTTGWHEENTEN